MLFRSGAFEHMKTPGARADELQQALAALDRAMAAYEKAKARSASEAEDATLAGYVARRGRIQKLLDFIQRYGEQALDLIPTAPIIRFQLHDQVMPRLLTEDHSALTPEILRLTDDVRFQIKEATGILVPGVRYGWLDDADAPEGAWLMTIDEGRATATGIVTPWGDALFPDLRDQLRQALEERLWACVTHDTIDTALEDAAAQEGGCDECGVVRGDLSLLNRLVTLARQRARGGGVLQDLGPFLKELVPSSSTTGTAAQPEAGNATPSSPAPTPSFRVTPDHRWWLDLQLGEVQQSLFQETGVIIPTPVIENDSSLDGEAPSPLAIGDEPMPTPTEDPAPTVHARLRSEIWRFVSEDLVLHYLSLIEETRPVLVHTARKLLGTTKIREEMVARLRKGDSVKNMATLLDESLAAVATAGAAVKHEVSAG